MTDWNKRFREETAAQRAEESRRLGEAKAQAERAGREKFCATRLRALLAYPVLPINDKFMPEYEERYYLGSYKTLEEFAELLTLSKLYDGGDMHLD